MDDCRYGQISRVGVHKHEYSKSAASSDQLTVLHNDPGAADSTKVLCYVGKILKTADQER